MIATGQYSTNRKKFEDRIYPYSSGKFIKPPEGKKEWKYAADYAIIARKRGTPPAGALLKSDREEAYLCLITAATASSPMGRTRL